MKANVREKMFTSNRKNYFIGINLFVLIQLLWGFNFLLAQTSPVDSTQVQTGEVDSPSAAKTPLKKNSPRGAVIRAVIFPGWGQWYNEKRFKALLVFGTEVGFASAAIWHNQQVVKSWKDYEDIYKEFHINMRNQFVWYLAGAILYSMADAYVDAHLYHFDESTDLSFQFDHEASASGSLCLVLKFSKSF